MSVGAGLVAAIAVQASATDADARSQGGILGNPYQASHNSCFNEVQGGPHQANCTPPVDLRDFPRDRRVPAWVMPLVYDNAGSTTVRVSAKGTGNGANIVQCRSFHAFSDGSFAHRADDRTELNTNQVEQLSLPITLPGFGAAWVTCWMERGTQIYNISY